jgi:hypothetical protein
VIFLDFWVKVHVPFFCAFDSWWQNFYKSTYFSTLTLLISSFSLPVMLGNNSNHLAAEEGKSATDRC